MEACTTTVWVARSPGGSTVLNVHHFPAENHALGKTGPHWSLLTIVTFYVGLKLVVAGPYFNFFIVQAGMISLLLQNLFNSSANMSRISLKFDVETLKTTKKNFHLKHFHSGLLDAGLLGEVEAELGHKWHGWCPQRCCPRLLGGHASELQPPVPLYRLTVQWMNWQLILAVLSSLTISPDDL